VIGTLKGALALGDKLTADYFAPLFLDCVPIISCFFDKGFQKEMAGFDTFSASLVVPSDAVPNSYG